MKATLSPAQTELLRRLPGVDELLGHPRLVELAARTDRGLVLEVARTVLGDLRASILESASQIVALHAESLEERIEQEVSRVWRARCNQ